MRITPPNYTQTPNDLFDYWLPHLGEAELKVLLVIMRKTFGWHKQRDRISISQLSKITGLLRETVINATKSLVQKGVIIKDVIGEKGSQETYYELVVGEDSNNCYQSVEPTPLVGFDLLGLTDSQKKGISTKETTTKQHAPTGARTAVVAPQKVKESKPAIHACLEKEDIPILDKDELTRRYDAKTVQNAIDFTQANRSKIKTTYVAYLKMACSKGLKIENYDKPTTTSIEPSEETIFNTREHAKNFIKENWNQCKSSVTDRVDHVRIGNDKLYYNDPKYYDLFKHYIRKLR